MADRGMTVRMAWEAAEYVSRRPWRLLARDRAELYRRAEADLSYDVGEPTRYDLMEASRAVLMAMRRPTDAMLASGAAASNIGVSVVEAAWEAMIDAALAEPPSDVSPPASRPRENTPDVRHAVAANNG